MQVGVVYNLIYVGNNARYAQINGKRTILVEATRPHLQYVQLYDQFGSPTTDDLRSGTITSVDLVAAFKETEIHEPTGEDEWFKHSMKVISFEEAIRLGILTSEMIVERARHGHRSVSVSGEGGRHLGHYVDFNVEDKTPQPYLQRVYIWWNSWEEMRVDFERHGAAIRP